MKWGAYYRQSPKTVLYRIGRRRKAAQGYYTQEQWQKLCSFFDRCPRCKRQVERFSPDHIRPASRGGSNFITNIQPLCWPCNKAKSNIYSFDYRPAHVKEWAEAEYQRMIDDSNKANHA